MRRKTNQIQGPYPLSAMREILDSIEENRNVRIDMGRVPLDDKKTLALFKKGDTEGVFGFGSPDMQDFFEAGEAGKF